MNATEAAKTQSFFREVNERMRERHESVDQLGGSADFLCECAREDCTHALRMTLNSYDEMRRVPTHFAVAAGIDHVFPDIERIFARRDGYLVVEKFGEAGIAAIRLDSRSRVPRVQLA